MNITVTNILYIDNNLDSIENFKKTIRKVNLTVNLLTADYKKSKVNSTVNLLSADSERAIEKALQAHKFNLIILNTVCNIITVAKLKALLIKLELTDVNVIAIIPEEDANNPFSYLNEGALFVSTEKNKEWLIHNLQKAISFDNLTTENRQYQLGVVELKNRSSNLLEDAHEPIAYLVDGAHIYANPAYLKLFGFEEFNELTSHTILDLISAEDQKTFKTNLKRAKLIKTPVEYHLTGIKYQTNENFEFNFKLENTTYQNQACQQLTVLIQKQDINELISNPNNAGNIQNSLSLVAGKNSELKLKFFDKIKEEQPKSAWLVLLMFDELNKIWYKQGIEACAAWMDSVNKAIEALLGEGAMLVEYSNNSILVLIKGCTLQESDRLTNSLRTICEDHKITFSGNDISTTCHATSMALSSDMTQFSETLKKLDRQSGILASVAVYDEEPEEKSEESSIEELFNLLHRSLQEQKCHAQFIPIASFTDLSIDRYQIDFTVQDANGEIVEWNRAPVEIYQHPILKLLDQWLVVQAVQNIMKALSTSPKGKCISIPLSATAAMDNVFYDWLVNIIEKSKIPPLYLSFGFSEELMTTFPKENNDLIQKLNKLGCKAYLYNFSTENLNLLDRYSFQLIAISSRFLNRISRTRDADLKAQARNAITIIQQKNLKIIADGVDGAPQMAIVWEYNLDFAQGSMISPPLDVMTFDFSAFASSF